MSETLSLQATPREKTGRKGAGVVRGEGLIPAVLYGHGIENQSLSVEATAFERVFAAAGESTLISLTVGDGAEAVQVLVHDVQRDPLSYRITHVDLYQVNMKEEIRAEVELNFVGIAPAVKNLGGILIKNITHVEVRCLPANLPHDIEVDISVLATFQDSIRVSDLSVGEGVSIEHEATDTVASVSEPRSEAELEALNEEVVDTTGDVEVEGADKGEEGDAEDADAKGDTASE